MVNAEPVQRVHFRVDTSSKDTNLYRDLYAVLPDAPANFGRWCGYVHIGQHFEGAGGFAHPKTRPATPEEYKFLLTELESIGYNLRVVQRIQRKQRTVDALEGDV